MNVTLPCEEYGTNYQTLYLFIMKSIRVTL